MTKGAETIQAKNSIEKMLAHQLAEAHKLAMMFVAKAQKIIKEEGSRWDRQEGLYATEVSQVDNA